MSIILDALKKSEAESQKGGAPGLYEVKVSPPRPPLSPWLVIVGVLLLVNAGALVWVLLRGSHGDAVTAAPTTAAQAPALAATTAGFTATPDVPSPVPPQGPPVDAPTHSVRSADAADSDTETDEDDTPAIAPPQATSRSAPRVVAANPGPGDNGGQHVYRVAPADAALPEGPPPAGGVPNYQQATGGGPLPDLTINMHSWSKVPSQRYILLNMARLREGDTSPQGVKVQSITQDGAVLVYQGREFSLQR